MASAGELVSWGDWGQACVMAFAYTDPKTGDRVTVEQAVRVARARDWTPSAAGSQAAIVCWGIFRSGLLRHPVLSSAAG